MPHTAPEVSRAAGLSLATNAGLSVLKLVMGAITGSVSVLADGANSAGDVLTSLLAWYAIRQAARSADEDHRYGHGKFESVSAALESLIIIVAGIAVAWETARRLMSGRYGEIDSGIALTVMAISALTNLTVSAYLRRVARRNDSLALRAEATHRGVDVWTSAGVLVGLIAIVTTGWSLLDPLLALAISIVIVFQGARLGREALHQLLDAALPPEEIETIEGLLGEHDDLFMDYHRLRTRKAGRERQVDLHLVICAHTTVQDAHDVADHLEKDIAGRLPHTRVLMHVEPCNEATCPNRGQAGRDPEACALRRQPEAPTEKTGVRHGRDPEDSGPGQPDHPRGDRDAPRPPG